MGVEVKYPGVCLWDMRYLEVEVDQPPADRDPMHQFLVENDAYGASRLLYRETYGDGEHAALFHVEGPVEPYRETLEARPSLQSFALDACPDDSFYLYARETIPADSQAFSAAFAQPGLLVITPVTYRPDGTVHVTAVGPADAVQSAVEAVPETMGVEVLAVGEYLAGRVDSRLELTQRQLEAVEIAVETGYYSATREATLADVADRLDCARGTAAELLRRAERTVMANLVADGPF